MIETVPYRHVVLLAHLARAKGIESAAVREQLALVDDTRVDLEARVPKARYCALLSAMDRDNADPSLWFDLGRQLTPVSMGHFGQLIMSCANLRQAMRNLCRFYPLVRCATDLDWQEPDDGHVYVRADGAAGREARMYIEGTVSALQRSFQVLCNAQASELAFEFAYPAPANVDAYLRYLGPRVAFGQPCTRVRVPSRWLDEPFAHADARVNTLLVEQCERYLESLLQPRSIVEEVAERVRRSPRLASTLEAVARELAMSPRTLSRRLSECGTRFDVIRQRVRQERAAALLSDRCLSIAGVADQVGFDDASNFARAFQRWTGRSPSRFRREQVGGELLQPSLPPQ